MPEVKATTPPDRPTITMEREFAAGPAAVFRAFTDAEALRRWYGPDGYTITVLSMDFRVGGLFRFIMHGPDGTDYPSRIAYREIVENERLAYLHGDDVDDDPSAFEVVITFSGLGAARTLVTMHSTLPSFEARDAVLKFGAVELGIQTLEKLAVYLESD